MRPGAGRGEIGEIHSYLVPVDGGPAAYHALTVACELAKRTHASVQVLHVIEVSRQLPLDEAPDAAVQRAEQILGRAERVASSLGVSVQGDLLQARQAAPAVVDEALDRGVDAIVIGVEYHRPLGEFQLGRMPTYLLEYAPCQVWLIRYPASPTPS